MTAKDVDKLVQALAQLGTPQSKRVINFRNNRLERDFEHLDYSKLVVPQDCNIPLTMEQQVAKIMYASGQIDEVTYARMIGITYDADGDDFSFEEYDEVLAEGRSKYASYEDEVVSVDSTISKKDALPPKQLETVDTTGAAAPDKSTSHRLSEGSGGSQNPPDSDSNLEE